MVVPALKTDILRRVVDFALESCDVADDDAASQLNKQACLANLILVSKAFKEICTPQLYKDCLVSDVNKFPFGPQGNPSSERPELLCKIKTLRIYHSNFRTGGSYTDLVTGTSRWKNIGRSSSPNCHVSSEWASITAFAYKDTFLAATRFHGGPRKRPGLFGALERICMTTTGDQSWGTRLEHHDLVARETSPLPNKLLRLPSVQHYCQSSMLGPLAIHNTAHKVTHPPKIATFHCPLHWDEETLYPIVLGSVNRYMSIRPTTLHVLEEGDLSMAGGIYLAFEHIMSMLQRPQTVVSWEADTLGPMDFVDSMMAGTTLEFYNFLQLSGSGNATDNTARLQKVLDSVAGPWTGRAFLKNKEDCPPCSACGHKYR